MNLPGNTIRLLTFNIFVDRGEEHPRPWKSHRESAFSLLRFYVPDIICLQEPLLHQVKDIANQLSEYEYFSVGCRDGEYAGEHMALFFMRKKFKLLKSGKFALSELPEKMGSVGWDAKNPRLAVWVKLLQIDSSKLFYIVNTHFDHVGEEARRQSALLLSQKSREIARRHPILICGDFNANTDSQTYRNMIAGGFSDVTESPCISGNNLLYTYHRYLLDSSDDDVSNYANDPRVLKVIDHIFYKGFNCRIRCSLSYY